MKKRFYKAHALFILITLCIAYFGSTFVNAAGLIDNEQDLSSGTDWGTVLNTATGASGTATNFGAYAFEAIGSNLYIGLAEGRPAESDGAMLVKFDGSTVSASGVLNEQGVHAMVTADNGNLVIAGSDPTDDWTYGNVYTHNGTTLTKYRATSGLTNVFHMWDLAKTTDGTLFAATSSHDGSQPVSCALGTTCFGEIYKSTNNGQSWTKTATLGDYRAYAIQAYNSKLYALADSDTTFNDLFVSSNNGVTWTRLTSTSDRTINRTSPVVHNNTLVVLGGSTSKNKLISVDENNSLTTHDLSFSVGYSYAETYYANYNQMVSVEGYLYVVTSDGAIKRSYDLDHWETISESASTYVSIGYWPQEKWILAGERGNGAKIKYVDLDSFTSVSATGLDSSLDLIDPHSDRDLTAASVFNYGTYKTARVKTDDGLVVSDIATDMTANRSWSGVTADSNSTTGKSYINNVTSISGAATTHTLYVPIPSGSSGTDVVICPSASSLSDVSTSCTGGVRFQSGDTATVGGSSVTVSKVIINSQSYWKAVGVAGSGGIDTTPDVGAPTINSIGTSSSLIQKITWTTDEASSSRVEYGRTSSLGSTTAVSDSSTRVTSHTVYLRGLQSCSEYFYKVHSIDASSNTFTSDVQSFTSYGC